MAAQSSCSKNFWRRPSKAKVAKAESVGISPRNDPYDVSIPRAPVEPLQALHKHLRFDPKPLTI